MSVYPSNNLPLICGGYDSATYTALGWLKLRSGQTKDQDFTLDSITCTPVP
jgi:hypothetical protein